MTAAHPPLTWQQLPGAPAGGTALVPQDTLPDGQVTMHTLASDDDATPPFRLLLLRSGQMVTAFANRCAHFGVPLAAKQSQLIFVPHVSLSCNVHYARYRWADGVCEAGDCAGESLIPIPVQVDAAGMVCLAA
jgi:nitrite reductase/ring-hydroxylating ferredoxin subunit